MRFQSILLLVAAMVFGSFLAYMIGVYWFPLTKPVTVKSVPSAQVLVAKKDLPVGTEIHADKVEFSFVPLEQIPVGSTTNFYEVYGRKTTYPIAKGSPICDMYLMDSTLSEPNQTAAGTQIVPFRIDKVYSSDVTGLPSSVSNVADSLQSLAQTLKPNDVVDVLVLESTKKNETGEARKKDEATQGILRSGPRVIAAGLKVFASVQPQSGTDVYVSDSIPGAGRPTISLAMTTEQLELTKEAAKEGRLQILVHPFSHENVEAVETVEAVSIAVAPQTNVYPEPIELKRQEPNEAYTGPEIIAVDDSTNTLDSADENIKEENAKVEVAVNKTDKQTSGAVIPVGVRTPLPATQNTAAPYRNNPVKPEQAEPKPAEKPKKRQVPKVVEIGIKSQKETPATRTASQPSESGTTDEISYPISKSPSSFEKSSGIPSKPAVQVVSFAPKKKKKIDLFPSYNYGSSINSVAMDSAVAMR